VRKIIREEKLCKYFNKTHFNCAVMKAGSRRGSEILTVISTVMANANIVNLTRGTGLNGDSLIMVLQDRNMSEQYKGTIYTHLWVAYIYSAVPFTHI
jgi:hypothetical protein